MAIEGPRAAHSHELPGIVALADGVFRRQSDGSMGEQYPLLFAEENAENLRIFCDDGAPVALVGIVERDIVLGPTRHCCGQIGSVCTHVDYRQQGLATRLVRDARAKAANDGCELLLISGGRGLYRRLGYVDVGGYRRATLRRSTLPRADAYRPEPVPPEALADLVRLHSQESVRFVRPPDDFRKLLASGRICDVQMEMRLLRARRGEAEAYLAFRPPGMGQSEDAICIQEVAGSRWALVQALPVLFDELGLGSVLIDYPEADVEMTALARTFSWKVEPQGFPGTVGIISPERFWRNCRPLFEERLGYDIVNRLGLTEGRRIAISLGQERIALDGMSELTKLAFLPEHRRGELALGLAQASPLRAALDCVFPMPLVSYGLNYV